MKKIFFIISLMFFFSSCKKIKTIYVASHKVTCQGEGSQKCFLIKENIDDEWTNFYDHIENFEYEEGYTYKIEVSIENDNTAAADSSSLKYSLIKVLSKEKDRSTPRNNKQIWSDVLYNVTSVEYTALSRGSFFGAKIDKNKISSSKDRNQKKYHSIDCTDKDWKIITSLIRKVNVKNMKNLKAPSEKRLFDGAPHAQLKVTSGNTTYTSTSFDHGNPPEELKTLVNTILSLSESVE